MKARNMLLTALVVFVSASCAEGDGLPLPGPDTKEVRIYFSSSSVRVGETVRAVAVGFFSRGVRLRSDGYPEKYSFELADTSIAGLEPASLGSPGAPAINIRGRRPGWAKVTAMINDIIGIDSVEVVPMDTAP